MGLLEEAASAIIGAERRNEVTSRNISNISTPGYKREISYDEISRMTGYSTTKISNLQSVKTVISNESGVLTESGSSLDFAIKGNGYFLVRDREAFFLSRGGQFSRDREGALVDGQGRILQQAGGGDLLTDTDTPQILGDGTVLSDGVPIGAIGLYSSDIRRSPDALRRGLDRNEALSLAETDQAEIAQGVLERSNVIMSDEMIALMRTQRLAEAGAQLVRAYDQLTGQAISTFGRRGT